MKRLMLGLFAATSFVAALAGCQAPPRAGGPEPLVSENPKAPDLALAEGDAYKKNASLKLAREYWIVVRKSDGSHYMYPRPDGAEAIAEACQGAGEAAAKFKAYALCQSAESEAAVQKINALSEGDAMFVSTFLHERLSFRRVEERVEPIPATSDILTLCQNDAELRKGALKGRCDDEEQYAKGGARPAIFRMYSEAELEALPAALNGLYGIAATP